MIDSPPPRLAAKVRQAREQGAQWIVIDTPPHADSAARAAVEVADLVLIPCRPSAFDLSAIEITSKLLSCSASPPMSFSPPDPRMHPGSIRKRANWWKAMVRHPVRSRYRIALPIAMPALKDGQSWKWSQPARLRTISGGYTDGHVVR